MANHYVIKERKSRVKLRFRVEDLVGFRYINKFRLWVGERNNWFFSELREQNVKINKLCNQYKIPWIVKVINM
jgi:hypothetical protein